jgi:hypothetical protein
MISKLLPESFKFVVIELIDFILYIYKSLQILNDIDVLINMISIELYTGIYMLITFNENQISLSYDYNHMELLMYINTSQK